MSVKSFKTSGVGVDLAPQGLVLINTTSFSGAVSHSFGSDASPIFSANYTNYKILLSNMSIATSSGGLSFRLRANTTDLTSGVYTRQNLQATSTTVSGAETVNGTSYELGTITNDATLRGAFSIEVFNPFETLVKNVICNFSRVASTNLISINGGSINSAVSHNGFTIFSPTNIAGTMSVYGYNK